MASMTKTATGWRIQWTDSAGNRKSLRFGKLEESHAKTMKTRIERLVAAASTSDAPTPELMTWLKGLGDVQYAKLAAVGLVPSREASRQWTLGELCEKYFANLGVKDGTRVTYLQARTMLEEHFSKGKKLASIGTLEGETWVTTLREGSLAKATQAKRIKVAKAIFAKGVRWGMMASNPLADMKAGSMRNPERAAFVSREDIGKVLDACPDSEWRAIVALSRYGGLRCPSETLALRWADIDWDAGRMLVRSCKTEGHEGGESRYCPLFPELVPYLRDAFEQAPEKSVHVVTSYRADDTNMRSQLLRILERAKVKAWPRLFHNLRASRQTELHAEFPLADCCAWLGNSPTVAASHYLQAQDENFKAATERTTGIKRDASAPSGAKSGAPVVQIGVKYKGGPSGTKSKELSQPLVTSTIMPDNEKPHTCVQGESMTPWGFEPQFLG